jgi:microcystin degradation protein MlrC
LTAVVGGIVHESSTFAAEVTGPVWEHQFEIVEGDRLMREFTGTNTCVGGYLAVCAELGIPVLPALHARAEPAGPVAPQAYLALEQRLFAALSPACDVVLLELHGAGVVVPDESLDHRLLRAVRQALPSGVPVAATMDLHANLTPETAGLVDVLVGFKRYPHTDMAEQASRAAGIALAAAAGSVRPCTRLLRVPMVLPPSTTDAGPAHELADLTRAAERRPGVLACTAFHGFPYADTPQAGACVVTVTDGDPDLADSVNRQVSGWLWNNRSRFLLSPPEPAEAVRQALAGPDRPAVVADAADNPGGGAAGDGTHLLRAILDSGTSACFATLYDPDTVRRAVATGVGRVEEFRLGGRFGSTSGEPVLVHARVRAVTDGRVVQQSMRRGQAVDFGPSARLQVDDIDVIVSSNRRQVLDPEILVLHGVVPERYELIAVKSAHHFRSGFAHLAHRMVLADGGGLTTCRIDSMPRPGPSGTLWPMNRSARFNPDAEFSTPVPLPTSGGVPTGEPDGAR